MSESKEILVVYYKDGSRFAGLMTEEAYYHALFPVLQQFLKPLNPTGIALLNALTKDLSQK